MQKNIILAGVGGQGILSIAYIIVNAARSKGLNVKQSEVHGMSQRGGPVYCHVRISSDEIYSDLIPEGKADLILGVEPMEALRYLPYLSSTGTIVTSGAMFKKSGYDLDQILDKIKEVPGSSIIDSESLAKKAGSPRAQNVVMVGAANKILELEEKSIFNCIEELFAKKKPELVELNFRAFELGKQAV